MTEAELRTESILDLLLDDKAFLDLLRSEINSTEEEDDQVLFLLQMAFRIAHVASLYDNLPPDHESLEYSRKA